MSKYYIQFDARTNMAVMTVMTEIPYVVLPDNTYEVTKEIFDSPIGQIAFNGTNVIVISEPKPVIWDIWDFQTNSWIDGRDPIEWGNNVKAERDAKLYQSDWTQIPNNPLTTEKQAEWATYRQNLRDITSQSGYPLNVIWPTPPI